MPPAQLDPDPTGSPSVQALVDSNDEHAPVGLVELRADQAHPARMYDY